MLKILVPIDGSNNTARVIEYVIRLARSLKEIEVCVLNVRDAMDSPQIRRFWSPEKIRAFQQDEGNLVLQSARKRLEEAGIAHTAEIALGDIAETIAEKAKVCDVIVMGTRGMGSVASLLLGSVASKVVHLADVPVALVK